MLKGTIRAEPIVKWKGDKTMDKVKIGVIGGGRGKSMIRYGREASNAELVAICDFRDDVLERTTTSS